MTDPHHNTNVEERLSRLEATVETFVLAVQKDIGDITAGLDSLRKTLSENSKPQYQTFFAGATVILMLGAFIGSNYVKDLRQSEEDVSNLQRDILSIYRNDAALRERVIAVERDLYGSNRAIRHAHEP